ncbi:hypothetical protein JMJ58_07250 [Haloterrigena salifodinae]|uniref:Uncharacterized protein n=1 Tax=Haloterrigena salifodinae TaxID=2675099 RepID=A0A8T8E5A0_9EURY|nr:hypothetical protein [Haloterrigena salifodinae]QRV16660.1 hypothetical protein JMJ58_07250 [Haloterrigena salifodinae]
MDIGTMIRTGLLALVAMLGVPAAVYFGLRGPLDVGTANTLALGSSVTIALAIVALLLWQKE